MNTHSKQLQEKLWAAAEQLRANGSLKLNEILVKHIYYDGFIL